MKFSKTALRQLKTMEGFNNRLSKRVINDLLATGLNTKDLEKHLQDIINYGCASGTVSSLIYYSDTVRFFDNYRKEIIDMAEEFLQYTDNLYDDNDKLYFTFNNGERYTEGQKKFTQEQKNILAWFAYEEIIQYIIGFFECN